MAFPACPEVDMAFGADLANPHTWVWTRMGQFVHNGQSRARLVDQTIVIERGRDDESEQSRPATTSITLDNSDGALTPGNPLSPYDPHVDLGLPLRVTVPGVERRLWVPGSDGAKASTLDDASLDITGDIFVAALIRPDALPPSGGFYNLGSKWAAGQISWRFLLSSTAILWWSWSTNGTALLQEPAPAKVPFPASGEVAVAVWLDVSNAGNHVITWYTAPSLAGPWVSFAQKTIGGTTSIHSGTAPLEVGDSTDLNLGFRGGIGAFQVRSGDQSGTIVANPDFAAQAEGTTSFVDSAGRTWSIVGGAEISATQVKFLGQVDEITPTWLYDDPVEAAVALQASGVFRRLGQGAPALQSTLRRSVMSAVNAPGVYAYWPMEDGSGATEFASPLAGVAPMVLGTAFAPASSSALAGSKALPRLSSGQLGSWIGFVPPNAPDDHWVVDVFNDLPVPEIEPTRTPLVYINTTGTVARWGVEVSATKLRVTGHNAAGSLVVDFLGNASPPFFAQPTSIRFEAVQNGGNIDWDLFWVPLDAAHSVFGFGDSVAGTLGKPISVAQVAVGPPDGLTQGHVIVSTLPLGALAGAERGYEGEAAAVRIMRLCSEESIPVLAVGDIDASEPMGPQRALTLPDLLRECATTDGGVLSELPRSPGVFYRCRDTLYNQDPALVLDHTQRALVAPFTPRRDDQRYHNDVTAQRPQGSSSRQVDQPAVDARGRYEDEIEVNVETDDRLADQASWRLHLGTWPGMRYPTVSVDLAIAPHLVEDWHATRLGDLVHVKNLPAGHPTDVVELLIEGTIEKISTEDWVIDLTCTPGGPWTVGVLDDDTPTPSLARLDTDGTTLETDLTLSATSVPITITGPAWTDAAAYYPLDIVIGGELMTATSLVEFFGPVLIVTRAVNGVAKAHTAGAPVTLADPLRLAL